MITVYVTSRIEFITLEPLLKYIKDNAIDYVVVFTKEIFDDYRKDFNSILLEESRLEKAARVVHFVLQVLFTKVKFSDQYERMIFGHYLRRKNVKSILYGMSMLVPGVKNINQFLHSTIGVLTPSAKIDDVVLVASLNRVPHLCCGKKYVITVMESWDHAMKIPNGYKSKFVYAWNTQLGQDWSTFQKDDFVFIGYPWKLSYSIENNLKKTKSVSSKVVYACAFSKEFSRQGFLKSERWFVSMLSSVVKELGLELFIKPRPLSTRSEEEYWLSLGKHVSVGTYSLSGSDASNYTLSEAYNKTRFEEIYDARVVINCYTTFGLDAVLYGKNVAQFDLSQVNQTARVINDNHHIKKYLNAFNGVYKPLDEEGLKNALKEACSLNSRKNLEYSERLRKWIKPTDSKEKRIKEIISSCESLSN